MQLEMWFLLTKHKMEVKSNHPQTHTIKRNLKIGTILKGKKEGLMSNMIEFIGYCF